MALDQAKFHGYWFDNAGPSASPQVFASYYTWDTPSPYRVVLVVGNVGRAEQPAALDPDYQRLGVAAEAEWIDLETGNTIAPDFMLPGNHFRLIGIR